MPTYTVSLKNQATGEVEYVTKLQAPNIAAVQNRIAGLFAHHDEVWPSIVIPSRHHGEVRFSAHTVIIEDRATIGKEKGMLEKNLRTLR